MTKYPNNLLTLPPGATHHVGSYKGSNGQILKIMLLPFDDDGDGILLWEQEQRTFDIKEIELKPLSVPMSNIFYLNYNYEY